MALKSLLTSKYSASGCENVAQCFWKQSSNPLGRVWLYRQKGCVVVVVAVGSSGLEVGFWFEDIHLLI